MKKIMILILSTTLLGACVATDPPLVKDGCAVDLKKVCQSIIDENLENGGLVAFSDGMRLDRQRLQNLSIRHLEILTPSRRSGAQLRCVVDTQSARVTDASISTGPELNDAEIASLREKGLCQ